MNVWQFLCRHYQNESGEDERGEEVVQCGSVAVIMTESIQDQGVFVKVRAILCSYFL